jgi:MFS family permease
MSLSPLLGANVIEHRRRVLPVGLAVGAMMRLQVLGVALAGLFLTGPSRLLVVCALLGLFGFFLGIQGVVFNYLTSKVIPVERRGSLLGFRNFAAGITASAVVYFVARRFIDNETLGDGYAATFLVAFGLTSLGLCMLLWMREPEPPHVHPRRNFLQGVRDLPSLLRGDRAFTLYFLARALAAMGRMATPFYILHAGTRIELSGANVSLLTVAFFLAQTTTNLAWGSIADRTGFRLVFLASLVTWIVSVLLLMSAAHMALLCAVFVGLGAGLGGYMMSAQNLVLEFGAREDLPMRIAVANSASEFVSAVGPVLGGILASASSYVVVFWVAIVFQCAGIAVVRLFVDEPRRRAGFAKG